MKKYILILSIFALMLPLHGAGRVHDQQIPGMVEKYFGRNRGGPTLMSCEVSRDFIYGRALKVKIRGSRNSENADLGFAFGAAAAVANYARTPIDVIWVEMDVRYKSLETSIAVAPTPCSVEAIVTKSRTYESWWKDCLEFL